MTAQQATCAMPSNVDLKAKLMSIAMPQNPILSRLKKSIANDKSDHIASSYSRMHNRHNRG